MARKPAKVEEYQDPLGIYKRLASATPEERTELVLQLIEQHPLGRLELPARDGLRAMLNGIDLNQMSLRDRFSEASEVPSWWSSDLFRVKLTYANLQGAELRKADFQGASLGSANLQETILEEANLQGADLANANLKGAILGEARLQGAMLEDANLENAILRFAHLQDAILEGANLQQADLWGANLESVELSGANLEKVNLQEVNLYRADLTGANLQGAILNKANLKDAILKGANLQGAVLRGANLHNAVLNEAMLQGVDLTSCTLTHVHLDSTWLDRTLLRQDQLGGAIAEELHDEYERANRGYLVLQRNFTALGDPDAASWAHSKRRQMQKLEARRRARIARAEGDRRTALDYYSQYIGSELVEWLCNYGESIPRVLRAILVIYLLFTLFYLATGSVVRIVETANGPVTVPTYNITDVATFSLLAMSTSGSPVVGLLPRNEWIHFITAIEALAGIALTALLGFVVAHRIIG